MGFPFAIRRSTLPEHPRNGQTWHGRTGKDGIRQGLPQTPVSRSLRTPWQDVRSRSSMLSDHPRRVEDRPNRTGISKIFCRLAEEDQAAGQCSHASAVDALDLRDDFLDVIEAKTRVDPPAPERRIDQDDPARPITVDLFDRTRKELAAED